MADEPKQDEREDAEGEVLPKRELMSVIGTDPADSMYSALLPADAPVGGPGEAEGPPHATLPVEPPETE